MGFKPATPETALKRACKQILTNCGWFNHAILQGLGSYPGIPDMLIAKGGRTVMLELKSPQGKQSEAQKKYQQDLEAAGGEYLLIDSIDAMIKWLQAQGERIS